MSRISSLINKLSTPPRLISFDDADEGAFGDTHNESGASLETCLWISVQKYHAVAEFDYENKLNFPLELDSNEILPQLFAVQLADKISACSNTV